MRWRDSEEAEVSVKDPVLWITALTVGRELCALAKAWLDCRERSELVVVVTPVRARDANETTKVPVARMRGGPRGRRREVQR